MRTDSFLRAPRAAASAAALAALLVAAPAGAAWSASADPADAPVTWAVTPSDTDGPDGRASMNLSVDPGVEVVEHLAVRNLGEAATTFSLVAADGYYTDSGRFNMLAADEVSTDAGTWISVQPTVTIAAGETAVIPFTVAVPEDAVPGDHTAGIAASVRTVATDADGSQVGVDSRVGFRVSARVSGGLAPALEVQGLRAAYAASWNLFAPGRVSVEYVVANTGNTALVVGDTIGGTETDHGSLLPGESRAVQVADLPAWPLGLLFLDVAVTGEVPEDELAATPVTETIVLWAMPWVQLLAAAGIALIVVAVFAGRRRNRRRIDELLEAARAEARAEGRRESEQAASATRAELP
ncbi:hypothetical protein [Agromyces seonyuensis]|uniref:DUF916 domain-containing protein n=1 Tax=Agromyces seonyuensis TaxID=2662446 RepID=A0A6I4P517_9MICO|nr:hypothetical protein [Agromyces seonyuensis]MWC00076.1 hypothetical protein [Agromyces seonyuensis]